jgi:hypothetical protein
MRSVGSVRHATCQEGPTPCCAYLSPMEGGFRVGRTARDILGGRRFFAGIPFARDEEHAGAS